MENNRKWVDIIDELTGYEVKTASKDVETTYVPWRNEQGRIVCDENNCSGDPCLSECPINKNTIALELLQNNKAEEAIKIYEEILEKDDDFVDAWSNCGSCYGAIGNYEKAYEYYKKAYDLEPRRTALYGLVMSAKDTGKSEEALNYYREYKTKFGSSNLDGLFENVAVEEKPEKPNIEPSEPKKLIVKFCRSCGTKLNEGSLFCHICGTKIVV